jgi:hypothetical protein
MRKVQSDTFELSSRQKMLDAVVHHEASLIRQHYTDMQLKYPGNYGKLEAAHKKAVSNLLAWQAYFKGSLRNQLSCWTEQAVTEPEGECFPLTCQRWMGMLQHLSVGQDTVLSTMINRMCIAFMLGWTTGLMLREWLGERQALLQEMQRQMNFNTPAGKQARGGGGLLPSTLLASKKPHCRE